MLYPWHDHSARFSPLKAATLFGAFAPAAWLFIRWLGGDLGGRPVTEAIHVMGDWAVRFLLITLAVTPARAVFDWSRVVLLRRMLGVTCACYAAGHLLLYFVDQKWVLWTVASEIVLRFYLTIGFVALSGLMVLAVTSTDGWQKRLRQRWKKLHRIVFAIAVLALFHYFLQSKVDVTSAVLLAGFFVWLALWRLAPKRWQSRVLWLAGLAPAAAVLTAAIEASWYALATRVNAVGVLWGNLDVAYGLRPAMQVLVLGLVVFAVAGLRRAFRRRRKVVSAAA